MNIKPISLVFISFILLIACLVDRYFIGEVRRFGLKFKT